MAMGIDGGQCPPYGVLLRRLQKAYAKGTVNLDQVIQRMRSWEAHLKYGDTDALREAIFSSTWFVRDSEEEETESLMLYK